ncbi:MAG: bifunctional glycosyltransferase/class I SAM-dependent methyltransferase [Spirochaetota bacterium]
MKTKRSTIIAPDNAAIEKAAALLLKKKIAVFIVMYNAEKYIARVLARIPDALRNKFAEIYIIDDSSRDTSFQEAMRAGTELGYKNLRVMRTPFNRGYGGNQKLGYLYAVRKKFDAVILLHGDGQYAPEHLPHMVNAFADTSVSVVLGSRMLVKTNALKGGMPLYKWVGNQVLTAFENAILKTRLSEFHTGYRGYAVQFLRSVPFELNSDDFHFDTEILIQAIATKQHMKEIAIPTFYGDETCHVNGVQYAMNCTKSVIKYRLTQWGLFYEPNFDFKLFETSAYNFKKAHNSLHQYILREKLPKHASLADLGANDGVLSAALAEKVGHVTAVDIHMPKHAGRAKAKALDLDGPFDAALKREAFDLVLALDVIEHLKSPESGIKKIFTIVKPGGYLYASTANIGYFVNRFSHMAGMFNYGKRGILDMTHKRLFTRYSFCKLLTQNGFIIKRKAHFGPPIVDMIGGNWILSIIDSLSSFLAAIWPTLFSYNFLIVAQRKDDIEDIYKRTVL